LIEKNDVAIGHCPFLPYSLCRVVLQKRKVHPIRGLCIVGAVSYFVDSVNLERQATVAFIEFFLE